MKPTNILDTPPSRVLTDYLYTKASHQLLPLSGAFELSPVCNFSCRMCYVRKSLKEVHSSPRKPLTLQQWRQIAHEARESGLLYLLLTGGEPLIWPDFWTLYDELIDMGFVLSVNTNASVIDDTAVAHFCRKPPQKVCITLYGASDATYRRLCGIDGVFSNVDRAIRKLSEAGITVKLNCSLTPDNAHDLDWILRYAKERDLSLAATAYMFPPVRRDPSMVGKNARFTPEQAAEYHMRYVKFDRSEAKFLTYLQKIRSGCCTPPGLDESCVDPTDGQIRCRAGKASFWVTWDGWLTPCGMMPEPKVDILANRFSQSWQELTELSAALRLSGLCETCANRNICHPCAAIALAETGTTEGIPRYKCEITRAMWEIAEKTLGNRP